MIVLTGILGLAALTLAWALRAAIKDIELAKYEAEEWEQKARAAARVAEHLAEVAPIPTVERPVVFDGMFCFVPGTIIH